jgi:hypothetical protein
MAFYLQYRDLRNRVRKQIDEFHDQEKDNLSQSRLSDDTTNAEAEATNKEGDSDGKDDFPYASLPGITLSMHNGSKYYKVSWENDDDPANPQNWSKGSRIGIIFLLIAIASVCTAASSVDSAVSRQATEALGVSETAEALGGTASFLFGLGAGALLCSPLSEMVGRYPVYIGTLVIFGCWLVGAALSPNIGAQIVFRFLAGTFASAPLTVAGGSVADIFNKKDRTWAFPLFAIVGFGGPTLVSAFLCHCSIWLVSNKS